MQGSSDQKIIDINIIESNVGRHLNLKNYLLNLIAPEFRGSNSSFYERLLNSKEHEVIKIRLNQITPNAINEVLAYISFYAFDEKWDLDENAEDSIKEYTLILAKRFKGDLTKLLENASNNIVAKQGITFESERVFAERFLIIGINLLCGFEFTNNNITLVENLIKIQKGEIPNKDLESNIVVNLRKSAETLYYNTNINYAALDDLYNQYKQSPTKELAEKYNNLIRLDHGELWDEKLPKSVINAFKEANSRILAKSFSKLHKGSKFSDNLVGEFNNYLYNHCSIEVIDQIMKIKQYDESENISIKGVLLQFVDWLIEQYEIITDKKFADEYGGTQTRDQYYSGILQKVLDTYESIDFNKSSKIEDKAPKEIEKPKKKELTESIQQPFSHKEKIQQQKNQIRNNKGSSLNGID